MGQQLREASELRPAWTWSCGAVNDGRVSLSFNVTAGGGGGTAAPGEATGSQGAAMMIEFSVKDESSGEFQLAQKELDQARRAVQLAEAKLAKLRHYEV